METPSELTYYPVESKKFLNIFDCLYTRHETLDRLLQLASRILVESINVTCCMLTWCKEGKTMEVRAASYLVGEDNFGKRIKTNPHRTSDIQNQWQAIQRLCYFETGSFRANGSVKKVIAPIRVCGAIVGYIYIPNHAMSESGPGRIDTELFKTICSHIGYAIELQELRQLRSHRALEANKPHESESKLGSHILAAVQDPEKEVKNIARSFYKELRKAGFETKQILVVASEIIDNLNQALAKTSAKTGRTGNNT